MATDADFVRTDPDQPPVAIRQRSPLTPTARVAYLCIGLLGGFGWTMIAIIRGEDVNSVWFVVAAVCTYIIAFRFYARLIQYKIVKPRDERATPAETHGNGKDFDATDRTSAVRAPLRGDRRGRPVGRTGTGRADGLPARNDVDHHRGRARRRRCRTTWCSGCPPAAAAAAWARWPATSWAGSAESPR